MATNNESNTPPRNLREEFKAAYSNVSNDTWYKIMPDDDLRNKYFKLMDGYQQNSLIQMKQNGQSEAFSYFKKAYAEGKKVADLLNQSFIIKDGKTYATEKWNDQIAEQLNVALNNFNGYHSLGQLSTQNSIGSDVKPTSESIKKAIDKSVSRGKVGDNHVVYDPSSGNLMAYKALKSQSQEVKRSDDFYTDIQTEGGDYSSLTARVISWTGNIGLAGVAEGYLGEKGSRTRADIDKTLGYNAWMKETGVHPVLKQKVGFITDNWLGQSMTLSDPKHKSSFKSETDFLKNQDKSIAMIADVIKGGINSKNQEVRTAALALNKEFWNKDLSKVDRRKLLSDSRFQGDINTLYNNSAYSYYDKASIYKKYKEDFNSRKYIRVDDALKNYTQTNNVNIDDARSARLNRLQKEIDQAFRVNDSYQEDYRKTKATMIDKLTASTVQHTFFKENMFNKRNDVISFEEFWSKLPANGFNSPLYTKNVQKYIEVYERNLYDYSKPVRNQVANYRLAGEMALKAVGEKGAEEFNLYNNIYNTKPGLGFGAKRENSAAMEESYNSYKHDYKKLWDTEFEAKHTYSQASMGFGLGSQGAYSIYHDDISLKSDSRKSAIANNFINNVMELTEGRDVPVYVKDGKWDHLESIKDHQESGASKESQKLLEKFFENKDKTTYRMEYVNKMRDKGMALYQFTDLSSNKKISVVLPKGAAKQFDKFAQAEYDDSDDFHFDLTGNQSLNPFGADELNHFSNVRIENRKGKKVLVATEQMLTGDKQAVETVKVIGDNQFVTFDEAVRISMESLRQADAAKDEFLQTLSEDGR